MDREDGANNSTWEFQHEKTSPRCIHVSKAWSLAVDFHGQLNSYSAGKGSSDLTRCKRFSTDLQLFYASYSLCISVQHKGESCSFLQKYFLSATLRYQNRVSRGIISSLWNLDYVLNHNTAGVITIHFKAWKQRTATEIKVYLIQIL